MTRKEIEDQVQNIRDAVLKDNPQAALEAALSIATDVLVNIQIIANALTTIANKK